ncbi:Asp-tRNA(Asn)/Glu-tRNA(Gln) amidotransferase subunit GatC [Spiroplasma platyhelix]|uniref:Asp-tRNA(Asn)/Glu-tRNA(Gln) amidotransferase GatCAB subunit C n=1 Tax=Spiroplasma platyhelix PALS-1 TaxID=1276218 RepID=A0A846TZZ2_9MOLU|nr:Asp-tRNA(Asn)/Glu-tRNA(Gln) amidotransferase GatCAB subunit C [Spiroplasma platyhelix]MBE4703803.1 Aspartyl/glutamyl-tRNA(Asn/Gln) amidotransferase subunit C [Spiroplasma platyhelix PALS-1]NKE38176.1 Asp-tRNA(Asn)/Glu-tRNA(Gln) amidotransferase GatCAB subunit C [Spiroplasma platyhelix PALS-1]UJB29061.1 aspartyl/glutamyl-tRNA amidotransferase subunit C [Spiroplasma platyhelix PALS-1]
MTKENPEITLNFLHQLAQDLFFELDDQQCQNLLLEFDAIEEQMAVVRKIDTENVAPLDFPFELKKNYLRSDTIESALTSSAVLSVAGQVENDYIVINKVINNEEN